MPPVSFAPQPLLVCDRCATILPGAVTNTFEPVACPGCRALLVAQVFPAFFRPIAVGAAAENVLSQEDASCFYHPAKKAVVPCTRCGRFLCALCDIDLGGNRHVCPGCVDAARRGPTGKQDAATDGLGVQRRVLYDSMALLIAALPLTLIFWWLSFFGVPVVLYLSIRYWNEPRRGDFPRTRVRFVIAALLAVLQIGGWITLGVYYYQRRTHGLD